MEELEKHARLFNLIAPVYNRFFRGQVQNYRSILDKYEDLLNIPLGGRVLDIGCGTGAFVNCLAERGYQAVGVDFSMSMLRAARKSTRGKSIEFVQGDVTKGLDFPDASFDYNKLVRNKIPQIIEQSGKQAIIEAVSGEEYLELLNAK